LKILIVSDAWRPQINGVVRTLEMTAEELARTGHQTMIAGPDVRRRTTASLPFYPEIKLEFFARRRLTRIFREFEPEYIHITTEGPLGWAARRICLERKLGFSTAYHTRFPEYLAQRTPRVVAGFVRLAAYAALRRFHAPSKAIMVATASIERELRAQAFSRIHRWSRGVDLSLFRPYSKDLPAFAHLPRPLLLYVGRLAVEKNLRAFLSLDTPGSKVVVGDGPDSDALKHEYPDAHFLGVMQDAELARCYAAADLFVFPSASDTFGLVLLEACASGLRIAALPAPGPLDIFGSEGDFTALDSDLGRAIARALTLTDDREPARAFARRFTWSACTEQFCAILRISPAGIGSVDLVDQPDIRPD
jgi:glycosyltransferase involved in cell wall biosynthesis